MIDTSLKQKWDKKAILDYAVSEAPKPYSEYGGN
ncbi:hypothetical protein SAMN05421747_10519 [Parapedobacter composti]|uniref:Uncharacterized protein n=1 Tax=Parapedobacter composti TaxID=623281 RepID=A0A1I1GPH4_9SPHI|nr:hypothetical protein SAMN05421747_10519 [Parapedobacter composti]